MYKKSICYYPIYYRNLSVIRPMVCKCWLAVQLLFLQPNCSWIQPSTHPFCFFPNCFKSWFHPSRVSLQLYGGTYKRTHFFIYLGGRYYPFNLTRESTNTPTIVTRQETKMNSISSYDILISVLLIYIMFMISHKIYFRLFIKISKICKF